MNHVALIMAIVLLGTFARADVLACSVTTAVNAAGKIERGSGLINTYSYSVKDAESSGMAEYYFNATFCGSARIGSLDIELEICKTGRNLYSMSSVVHGERHIQAAPFKLFNGRAQLIYKKSEFVSCALIK